MCRLRVVPHFSSGIVEREKRRHAAGREKNDLPPRRVWPFLAWGDFHARSRFVRSTLPEEKWGTTLSLLNVRLKAAKKICSVKL